MSAQCKWPTANPRDPAKPPPPAAKPRSNLSHSSRFSPSHHLSSLSLSSPTAASSHHPLLFSNYSFTVLSSVILLLFTNSFSNLYYYLTRVLVAFLLSGYRSRAIRFQPPQSFFFFFYAGIDSCSLSSGPLARLSSS